MAITAKTSVQAIIDAVNEDNLGLNLTLEQVTVGEVVEVVDGTGESSIVLTAKEGKGYQGTATITYDRQPAAVAIGALGECEIPAEVTEQADIVLWIMENYIVKSPVPMDENVELKVNALAKAATIEFTNHKILFGEHSFNYNVAAPVVPDLDKAIENKDLAGFTADDVKPAGE